MSGAPAPASSATRATLATSTGRTSSPTAGRRSGKASAPQERLGGFHERLGEGGVSVDRRREILDGERRLDGERALGDELAGARAHDADAEDAARVRVRDELRQAVASPERQGTAGGRPLALGHLDRATLALRL